MFWTRYVKGVPFVNKEVPLFCQKVLKGLDFCAEPPCMTLCWVPTPTRALNGFFPIRKFERNAALSLWLQVGGQQKSYPLGESLGCLLSLPRASAILYGTQASFAWPRARWSGQIWQICNGHFFWFHGICWIRFASLGEASWSEYLRQFCFHDLGVVMYRCGLNFVKNVVLESESMWYGG